MIKDDYVPYELAKLLKEKGFDAYCRAYYDTTCNNTIHFEKNEIEASECEVHSAILAPTLQMATKWLRKKGFHIFVPMEIDYDEDERGDKWYRDAAYYPEIIRVSDGKAMYDDGRLYTEPEQACEAAIKYCLENLI